MNISKKKQEAKDAANYLAQMTYLLMSNSPVQLSTTADFTAFQNDFFSHLDDALSGSNSNDSEYFSDLGNRLEVVANQAMDIQVPETMVDLHVKFLRIAFSFFSSIWYSLSRGLSVLLLV